MSDMLFELEEHSAVVAAVEDGEQAGNNDGVRDETVFEAFVREQKARVKAINEVSGL
jgi:hypothetical protein